MHPADHVDEAIEIELQLEGAVAGNHCEHRFEEEPEVATEQAAEDAWRLGRWHQKTNHWQALASLEWDSQVLNPARR